MSNSGSDGARGGFSRGPVGGDFLHSSRPLFDDDRTDAELHELKRLVDKYPAKARQFLDGSPDGSGSPP